MFLRVIYVLTLSWIGANIWVDRDLLTFPVMKSWYYYYVNWSSVFWQLNKICQKINSEEGRLTEMSENMQMQGLWASFKETIWLPLTKSSAKTSALFIFIFFLLAGAFLSTRFLDTSVSCYHFRKKKKKNWHMNLIMFDNSGSYVCTLMWKKEKVTFMYVILMASFSLLDFKIACFQSTWHGLVIKKSNWIWFYSSLSVSWRNNYKKFNLRSFCY